MTGEHLERLARAAAASVADIIGFRALLYPEG
jgi:hypothetical protein